MHRPPTGSIGRKNMIVDVEIERIRNGFIVREKENGTEVSTYYQSMHDFVALKILDPQKELDRYFKEHKTDGEKRRLTFSIGNLLGECPFET
jgi:hypothetical protein